MMTNNPKAQQPQENPSTNPGLVTKPFHIIILILNYLVHWGLFNVVCVLVELVFWLFHSYINVVDVGMQYLNKW